MQNNVLKYEPDLALFVSDEDPLIFYRHIASLALKSGRKTKRSSYTLRSINIWEQTYVAFWTEIGFKNIELRKDMYGADRMIRAVKN